MTLLPKVKLKMMPTFPSNIIGGVGLEATKENGKITLDYAWQEFGSISAIPTQPTAMILTYDTATNAYVMVPSHLLGGAVSGIADAPGDGFPYARLSGNWTRVPYVNVSDFTTATQAASAVTGRTGGGTIVVPNGATPTLPASYPNISYEYSGPGVPFDFRLEVAPSPVDISTKVIRSQLPLSPPGVSQSVMAIENRPIGAANNGPTEGTYALKLSSIKQNWKTTTQPGEVGGIVIAACNGGLSGGHQSDVSAILMEVQSQGNASFACGIEGVTYNGAGGPALKGMDYQIGVIDTVGGDSFGMAISAQVGVIGKGILIQASVGASIGIPIIYSDSVGPRFVLDQAGSVFCNDVFINAGTWIPYIPTVSVPATATARYRALGKTVTFTMKIILTTNTSAAVTATLPFTATNMEVICAGRENAVTGQMLQGFIPVGSSTINISKSDNTNPGTSGWTLIVSGTYER